MSTCVKYPQICLIEYGCSMQQFKSATHEQKPVTWMYFLSVKIELNWMGQKEVGMNALLFIDHWLPIGNYKSFFYAIIHSAGLIKMQTASSQRRREEEEHWPIYFKHIKNFLSLFQLNGWRFIAMHCCSGQPDGCASSPNLWSEKGRVNSATWSLSEFAF